MPDNKIYIPTLISTPEYKPARVEPRLFYWNGMIEAPDYKVYAWTIPSGVSSNIFTFSEMPYVDHYNVVSGSYPSANSDSLLFFNEVAAYGSIPSNTLFSEYWNTYISLLYNPTTRLINASAVIPLARYFELELNDIVEWRGNYYQLRAINDYSFTTGECNIQLLGPIIDNTLDGKFVPGPQPTTTTTTTTSTTTTSTTTTTTTTTTSTTTTTTTAAQNYLIEECNTLSLYNVEKTYSFIVGDVVQFQVGTPGSGTILCGTITSDTFSGTADATLWSGVAYECGDFIHCDIPPVENTIYTHGAVRGTCSDYCTTNYNIGTLTYADNTYAALTIGDTIYGQGGSAGYVAYSNTITDTDTGPFKIAEIDSSGVIISILECVGNACVPL